jgi:transposase
MTILTAEQVNGIPALVESGLTCGQIGKLYKCHERTINYWIKRLRGEGVEVKTTKGRKKVKINEHS